MTTDAFALYGTHEAEERPVTLTAGRLSADLVNGNLRTIRYDGIEVLRAISYLVRDRDWGTYSPRIEGLAVKQDGDSFSIGYTAHCDGPDASRLAIAVRIEASENELTFVAEALSPTGFETNRCGFCILHPIVGIAGTPATVEHVDGHIVETRFPDQIEPWQPFMDMRAISHSVTAGVSARCLMEGDTFEMEDQRNWSDASYKTYVRPLALPWPYHVPANEQQACCGAGRRSEAGDHRQGQEDRRNAVDRPDRDTRRGQGDTRGRFAPCRNRPAGTALPLRSAGRPWPLGLHRFRGADKYPSRHDDAGDRPALQGITGRGSRRDCC
jgi:hypothetical protein